MKFLNILQKLYCEPWHILPQFHVKMCEIVSNHIEHTPQFDMFVQDQFPGEGNQGGGHTESGEIAIVEIVGPIAKRVGGFAKMSGATDLVALDATMQELAQDESIRGIVLQMDSPGGDAVGLSEVAERIGAIEKPVVAFTDSNMHSAAYYLAAGADAIYASKSAMVGSIGTYMAMLDVSRNFKKEGIKTELFTSGKYKGMGVPGTSLTADQREYLQDTVDQYSLMFKDFVTSNREVPDSAMEGQSFLAEDAVRNGLVDAIGSLEDAVQEAADMAA